MWNTWDVYMEEYQLSNMSFIYLDVNHPYKAPKVSYSNRTTSSYVLYGVNSYHMPIYLFGYHHLNLMVFHALIIFHINYVIEISIKLLINQHMLRSTDKGVV